jgi:uncharacterized protein (DUF305 family)
MKNLRTLAVASAAIAAALVLAGCAPQVGMPGMDRGPGEMMPSDTAGVANAADEMFVTMMIPHHEQAIEMADLMLAKNDVDPQVVDLAQRIKDAQRPEIDTMLGWLDDWGIDYDDSMGGMDYGGGMMSAGDMAALESADGPQASRLFLEQMIVHHEGAIDMAQSAATSGQNPNVVALAEQVIEDQTAEIAIMRELLDSL